MTRAYLLAAVLAAFGCDTGGAPAAPTPPDGPRFSNDIDAFLNGVEPDPVTVYEQAVVTVRTTAPYAADLYAGIHVTPPGELIRERSVHFPSGETEATLRIGVTKAGEWKVQLKSLHDPAPDDADLQVGSPSTLTFRAVP